MTPEREAWREEYAERQAKGERFQMLGTYGAWSDANLWYFGADKDQYRPKPVDPAVEAPAFDANRLLTDDEKRDDELIVLRAEVARLQAVNRIAIRHLDKVLEKGYDFDEHRGVLDSVCEAPRHRQSNGRNKMTTQLNPATVEVDGKIYDAVPCGAGRCRDCVARLERELCDKLRDASPCVSSYRADDTDVHYVERKPDPEAWRQEYRDRQAKGEKFQRLDISSKKWCNDSWEFTADKHLYRPKPVEPVFEAPAELDDKDDVPIDDKLDWAEKGLAEWREVAIHQGKELARLQAVNRIAIRHLDKVLKKGYDFDEHRGVVAEARDWLASIGGVA